MSRKQTQRGGLAAPQIPSPATVARDELRELASKFLQMVRYLPCRPTPRSAWDNRARQDQRVPHPCHDAIALARSAHNAAIDTGNVEIIRGTRLEIEEYFDLCKTAALMLPAHARSVHRLPLGAPSAAQTYLTLIKENSEATVAVATAQFAPTESAIAHARREVREMVAAGLDWLGLSSPSSSAQQVS